MNSPNSLEAEPDDVEGGGGGGGSPEQDEYNSVGTVKLLLKLLSTRTVDPAIQVQAAGAIWAACTAHRGNAEQLNALGGVPVLVWMISDNGMGDAESKEQCVGVLSVVCHVSDSCVTTLLSVGGIRVLIKLLSLGDDGLGEFGTQELAAETLCVACERSEGCRTDARRAGIRQVIYTVINSPLLDAPNALQRQQAQSARKWAMRLLKVLNVPPPQGAGIERIDSKELSVRHIAQIVNLQRTLRGMYARKRARELAGLSEDLRKAILKLDYLCSEERAFLANIKNHPGTQAEHMRTTMDQSEFMEMMRKIGMLRLGHADRCKISKTEATQLFYAAVREKRNDGRSKPAGRAQGELDFQGFIRCIKRCIFMVKQTEKREKERAKQDNEPGDDLAELDAKIAKIEAAKSGGEQADSPARVQPRKKMPKKPTDAFRSLVPDQSVLHILLGGGQPPENPGADHRGR